MEQGFWLAVAVILCLLVVLFVWQAQRLINSFAPAKMFRPASLCALPIVTRIVLIVALWAGTAAALTFTLVSLILASGKWASLLTPTTLISFAGMAMSVSTPSIFLAAVATREHWRRKQPDALVPQRQGTIPNEHQQHEERLV